MSEIDKIEKAFEKREQEILSKRFNEHINRCLNQEMRNRAENDKAFTAPLDPKSDKSTAIYKWAIKELLETPVHMNIPVDNGIFIHTFLTAIDNVRVLDPLTLSVVLEIEVEEHPKDYIVPKGVNPNLLGWERVEGDHGIFYYATYTIQNNTVYDKELGCCVPAKNSLNNVIEAMSWFEEYNKAQEIGDEGSSSENFNMEIS